MVGNSPWTLSHCLTSGESAGAEAPPRADEAFTKDSPTPLLTACEGRFLTFFDGVGETIGYEIQADVVLKKRL